MTLKHDGPEHDVGREITGVNPAVVSLSHVTFGYDDEVILRDVSLTIRSGDFLAIIGPNGGGKTTLLKLLLGLIQPWQGNVTWHRTLGRGRIGYVQQFSTFDKHFPLSVLDVALMGRLGQRGLWRRYTEQDVLLAESALERLHLHSMKHSPVSQLSGGQRQRLLIARALACEPQLLLMDEPTSSVDTETRIALNTLLAELNREIPVIVVTHDVTAFASLVKQFACVNRKLFYHGQPELTAQMLEEAYGCPVELIAHGTPHRVLHTHT